MRRLVFGLSHKIHPQILRMSQKEGLGFPILRCVCLISMVTGMLFDLGYAAYSGKGTGETAILRQLRSSLRAGDIVVADSYHCTYWFIAMCLQIERKKVSGTELVL